MVSRLLSSLSGMLSSGSKESKPTVAVQDDKTTEKDVEEADSVAEVREQVNRILRKKNGSLNEIFNAESLDRAIVHRLQSSANTSLSEKLSDPDVSKDNDNELRLHTDDDVECGSQCRISTANTYKVRLESSFPGTHRSPSRSRPPSVRASNQKVEEEPEMHESQDITVKSASEIIKQNADMLHFNRHTTGPQIPGDTRNVMYKNSLFNMENSSKEALIADTMKPFDEGDSLSLSQTLLNLPMFGIPDPAQYRQPSLTSSTESVRGTDVPASNASLFVAAHARKNRSTSSSPTRGSVSSRQKSFSRRLSTSKIGEKLFEETMNEIIEKGGEDFKNKYSSWVWDVFRVHLGKMKSFLLTEFNQKLKETVDDRENEITDLQQQYREKLSEFDTTTDGFQKLIDNLYQENQRVLKAKDFIIEKLKKEFLECKKHFEQDLMRQMQSYRKEAEVEKIELQKRNDELMTIMLTDASKSGMEDAFKREIESLHKMIKALTAQNELLHQQLGDSKSSVSAFTQKSMEAMQSHLDNAKIEIMELRKKLQYADREKEDLTISHHGVIAKLHRKIQESNTRYDHRLQEAAEEQETLRRKHSKEIKDLKQKLAHQETQYNQAFLQVKQQYGGQVESLSRAVTELQNELTTNVVSRKFS